MYNTGDYFFHQMLPLILEKVFYDNTSHVLDVPKDLKTYYKWI